MSTDNSTDTITIEPEIADVYRAAEVPRTCASCKETHPTRRMAFCSIHGKWYCSGKCFTFHPAGVA
jgi:hypothetical protein